MVTAELAERLTRQAWLRRAARALHGVSSSPGLDAEVILGAILELTRTRLLCDERRALETAEQVAADALLARRVTGEPIAYLLGEQEFWSLSLRVTPAVLVPRPETEGVVERGLRCIAGQTRPRILDLGTGSGAIALALARERPDAAVVGADVSAAAVAVARENSARLGLAVSFVVGSWYAPLRDGDRFDLVVSNPPYVAEGDPLLETGVARHEPPLALYGGNDGMDALRAVVAGAPTRLAPGGWLVAEHGARQGVKACALLRGAGFIDVADDADLAGLPRVAYGRLPGRRD
ncbi:MAG TPA: peptide chain release factor N(5)-glutamine methyltransferase [Nevskiaceae bacterium]